jgi:UDP-N-acetylmuramate--alanine ligase
MLRPHPETRIHFVGIGGVGMSGIAEILLALGYRVSGSDLRESDATRRLAGLGGVVVAGHAEANLRLLGATADVVVVSSAVRPDNPEVAAARREHVPVIPRAEMLAELMRLKYGIAVAGSHGKTTTTSLVATVLKAAGLDPTAVVGGKLAELGSGARLGQSEYLVAEADESDGSFLQLSPAVAIVTNIDAEHLDHYGDFDRLIAAFLDFINKVPFYGRAVLCIDHPVVRGLVPDVQKRYVTYGLSADADYRATDVRCEGLCTSFLALRRGEPLGRVTLRMPGIHNAVNALAVLAVSDFLGVPFATYTEALSGFLGVGRRFTVRGEARLPGAAAGDAILVIDDYGHHPAEIRATLAAARAGFPGRRVVCAFQPHRYTRTRDLMDEFATAFSDAAQVFLCDVYAAGEPPISGVSSEILCEKIRAAGHPEVAYVPRRADLATTVRASIRPGDLFITLGAGDVWQSGEELLRLICEK